MINEVNAKLYCSEDISLIENYDKAIEDTTQVWECHHRLEIQGDKYTSPAELKELGMYWGVEAKYLVFMPTFEHNKLHNKFRHPGKGIKRTTEQKEQISNTLKNYFKTHQSPMKGKKQKIYKWETPNGEIRIMDIGNAHRFHRDWKLIGEV